MLKQIVTKAKDKINMVYIRPGGQEGHCYLDPSVPMRFRLGERDYPKSLESYHSSKVNWDEAYFQFHKQTTHAPIFVKLKNVRIHSKQKDMVMRILYGT